MPQYTHYSGVVAFGTAAKAGTATTIPPNTPTTVGPGSISYQQDVMLDSGFPYQPGQDNSLWVGFSTGSRIIALDVIPANITTACIASAQVGVANTALTLATTAANGVTPVTQIVRPDNSIFTPVTNSALAIDGPYAPILVGHVAPSTGLNATINSTQTTLTLNAAGVFAPYGPYYLQLGTGSAAEVVIVTAGFGTTGLTITRGALNTTPAAQNAATTIIGLTHSNPGGGNKSTLGSNWVGCVFDPQRALSRPVSIFSGGDDSTVTFTVAGYDWRGNRQTEAITGANGSGATNTALGVKGFKYVTSVAPSANTAANVSVGIQDIGGLPFYISDSSRADVVFNGLRVTSLGTAITVGNVLAPATTTSGDPKGKVTFPSASTGGKRLYVTIDPAVGDIMLTNAGSVAPLFGVTPV